MNLLVFFDFLKTISPFISPFLAFFLGLWAAGILERRKALYAVRGRIQVTLDELSDATDIREAHKRSIDLIKEPIFSALPLLRKAKQDRVKMVWKNYRRLAMDKYTADHERFLIAVSRGLGESVTTQSEAMAESLKALDKALR